MKAKLPIIMARFCALAAAGQIESAVAAGDVAPRSTLQVAREPDGSIRLTLTNAGNHQWTIQSSRNLQQWTDTETVKVHNGHLILTYPSGGGDFIGYRAAHDSTGQNLLSELSSALKLPATPFNYAAPELPGSFRVNPILAQDNTPANNLTTDAGATLGRTLFYDKRLSSNQTVSCSSCHQQAHGFSDPRRFSVGFDGREGDRNSMGLSNARWYQRRRFFWDERSATLEDQTLQPIQNPIEMGMSLPALTNRLLSEPFYTNLFVQAFGTPAVTTNRIARALAQFVRSIVSTRSKYDVGVTSNFSNFTAQENVGRQLFFGGLGGPPACAACHGTDNFSPGPALHNNGLEFPFVDKGVGGVTGVAGDEGKFKVPSLRDIEKTAPYMHDGRFATLEQVVDFYSTGVVNNPNLSQPLRAPNGQAVRLNFTVAQKAALVAFLKTLTDTNLANDPKLSDPFNYGR